MKQIDEYIMSNKKLKEELEWEFERTDPSKDTELRRLEMYIERVDYYIKGLEDAKKYILEERGE